MSRCRTNLVVKPMMGVLHSMQMGRHMQVVVVYKKLELEVSALAISAPKLCEKVNIVGRILRKKFAAIKANS